MSRTSTAHRMADLERYTSNPARPAAPSPAAILAPGAAVARNASRRLLQVLVLLLVLVLASVAAPGAGAATITVNSVADSDQDDSACTLREAILTASLDVDRNGDCGVAGSPHPEEDRIVFQVSLWPSGTTERTVQLAAPLPPLEGNTSIRTPNGLPPTGRRYLRLRGSSSYRLMRIVRPAGAPATVVLEGLRFVDGGLDPFHVPLAGAAIALDPGVGLDVSYAHFENNLASLGGAEGGGAIAVVGTCASCPTARLRVFRSDFIGNSAGTSRGGAILVDVEDNEQTLELDSVLLSGNEAGDGSAVYYENSGPSGAAREQDLALSRVRVVDNIILDGAGSAHLHLRIRDDAFAQVGIRIEDTRLQGNTTLSGLPATAMLLSAAAKAVRLQRLSVLDNDGGALAAEGAPITLVNSLFRDNQAAAGSYPPVFLLPTASAHVAGNSFIRNRMLPLVASQYESHQLTIGAEEGVLANLLFNGNLFVRANAVAVAEPQCVLVGVSVAANDNVSDHHSCALGDGAVHAANLELVEVSLPGTIHAAAVYPAPGNPALEGWRSLHCVDSFGDPLQTDALGSLRPVDGDADGEARCDAGAFETPAGFNADALFGDGFE